MTAKAKDPERRQPKSFKLSTKETSPDSDGSGTAASQSGGHKKKNIKRAPKAIRATPELVMLPEDAVDEAYQTAETLTPPPPRPVKTGFGWGKLMVAAFLALAGLAAGLALDQFIRELFARNDWLGWAALVLTGLGALGLGGLLTREILAISRMARIDALRVRAEKASENNDLTAARATAVEIAALFSARPETAHGRSELQQHGEAVMSAGDLLYLTERDLLRPLDREARRMVMNSAKRVSIVTAVSPRALIDIAYVLLENTRLIRKISEHYGGRPGTLSAFGLVRRVLLHLAATGAIAIGDGVLQQVVGHGIAARVSARLGEGVVNGLLTARIGIAAIDVCRPLAFHAETRPGVNDFLGELTNFGKSGHSKPNEPVDTP